MAANRRPPSVKESEREVDLDPEPLQSFEQTEKQHQKNHKE
jgi:hypothetical protein